MAAFISRLILTLIFCFCCFNCGAESLTGTLESQAKQLYNKYFKTGSTDGIAFYGSEPFKQKNTNFAEDLRNKYYFGNGYFDMKMLKIAIEAGADITSKDENGNTALMYVCLFNNPHLTRYMLKLGADAKAKNNKGENILQFVIKSGVSYKLLSGLEPVLSYIDLNNKDCSGHNAYYYTANNDSAEEAIYLLEHGLNANFTYKDGKTPLFYAVSRPYFRLREIDLILKSGVDINRRDSEGKTALFYAVNNKPHGSKNLIGLIGLIYTLLGRGANPLIKDNYQLTPFDYATTKEHLNNSPILAILNPQMPSSARKENIKNYHMNLISLYENLSSPYELSIDDVENAVYTGLSVNAKNASGVTLLMFACKYAINDYSYDNIDIIEYLIKMGADINAKDKLGKTALDYAEGNSSIADTDRVRRLFNKPANLAEKFKMKADLLKSVYKEEIADCLANGYDVNSRIRDKNGSETGETALMYLCLLNNAECINFLLEQGANPKATCKDGGCIWHFLCKMGHVINEAHDEIFKYLSVDSKDCHGHSAYYYAAQDGGDCAFALLQRGANANFRYENGKTPLFYAVDFGASAKETDLILKSGLNVNQQDNEGKTALFYLASKKKIQKELTDEAMKDLEQIARLLLKAGANPLIKDLKGKTAFDYIKDIKCFEGSEIYKLLKPASRR